MTPEQQDDARRNREAAPEFAEFVDAMRAKFGNCRVRYVKWPDGREQGKRLEDRRG